MIETCKHEWHYMFYPVSIGYVQDRYCYKCKKLESNVKI